MIGFIKRIKLAYEIYNIFHPKSLSHNIPVYKKLGIKKKYFSSISSNDFKNLTVDKTATIPKSFPELSQSKIYARLNQENKESLELFNQQGYSIIKHFLSETEVDEINSEIDQLISSGHVVKGYQGKIMFAIHKSDILRRLGENKDIIDLLCSITKREMKLFQSINFLYGSEQKTHSDSIHMTTYPLGGLLGVWFALEDIDESNGPLHYYPGSHALPYYLNADYNNEGNRFLLGPKDYKEYEAMIDKKIIENKIEKKIFKAQKGDVLIWHANLMHGGEPHIDKSRTRKSMVFHYFDVNSICYHEITQRPALMK